MRCAGQIVATALLTLSSLSLGGCLISGHSNDCLTGSYVGPQTFSQIEAHVTKTEWVIATLGEPDSKSPLSDGSEIWKWAYTKKKSSSGAVLFVFGGSSKSETAGATFVQIKDGLVVKAWQD